MRAGGAGFTGVARVARERAFVHPDCGSDSVIPNSSAFLSLFLLVRHKRTTVENKIAVHPVLRYEASLIRRKSLNDLDAENRLRFEQLVLPHVDVAFNFARWLLRGRADAEDVAQEALFRACRFFRGFHGGDVRAWLLQIVRNTCYSWLE